MTSSSCKKRALLFRAYVVNLPSGCRVLGHIAMPLLLVAEASWQATRPQTKALRTHSSQLLGPTCKNYYPEDLDAPARDPESSCLRKPNAKILQYPTLNPKP